MKDSLWQFLVDSTNIHEKMASGTGTAGSLYWNWKLVSVNEMNAFVVVILKMGIIQMTNLKDYWCTQSLFQNLGVLHLGNTKSTLKRDKIQPLLDCLLPAFLSAFSPL